MEVIDDKKLENSGYLRTIIVKAVFMRANKSARFLMLVARVVRKFEFPAGPDSNKSAFSLRRVFIVAMLEV
jgi:hypothetical protein